MEIRNVICLACDRLRAAALGAYGAAWCETEAFDRLAAESFVFDQMLVDSFDLGLIYRGLWQGLHSLAPEKFAGTVPSLPALLGEQNITTILFTDEDLVAAHPLASDFHECIRLTTESVATRAGTVSQTQLARFFAEAVQLVDGLESNVPGPFFLWLHCRAMAGPWDAPRTFRTDLADEDDPEPPDFIEPPKLRLAENYDPDELLGIGQAYAGQIQVLDECCSAFADRIRAGRFAEKTLLAMLGTRGFALGEHLDVGSAAGRLYSESLHVPLLLRFPGGEGALLRDSNLIHPADLFVTIGEWLGALQIPSRSGVSLLPLIDGEDRVIHDHLVMAVDDRERAIRTSAWHLRCERSGESAELFAKPDDRWEINDVSDRCADVTAGLVEAAAQFEQAAENDAGPPIPPLDEKLLRRPD